MLKVRIMPTLLWKDVSLVKGVSFKSDRRVGSLLPSVRIYSSRDVDELIFLDITATQQSRSPDFDMVQEIAKEVSVPFTVGGGVASIEDIRNLLLAGADKVSINSAIYKDKDLIEEGAKVFGTQCIVASIDFKRVGNQAKCISHSGSKLEKFSVIEWAKRVEEMGSGEILLTSIERDGTMTGFDCEAVQQVIDAVKIPVIASGGAGSPQDVYEVIEKSNASAVAAASIFHFTEQTPLEIKEYLHKRGVSVRK